ncbi:MAG: LysM peptidoglycan-binding domain-containing protein [Candidatus Hydrothermae bacterium]|nr:LysM peptidoglycan-binding domain-containing protein [Candidatus Hydrothermae bacterium]
MLPRFDFPPLPRLAVTHTVAYGETLWDIAARYYGTPDAWDLLYAVNREAIGDTPEDLQPGTVLEIPLRDLLARGRHVAGPAPRWRLWRNAWGVLARIQPLHDDTVEDLFFARGLLR